MSGAQNTVSSTASIGSYQERAIDITIKLGQGTFGQTGQNTVKLSNLRIVCTINRYGSPAQDRAMARVYGVPPSIMNAISTLGVPLTMWRFGNEMLIEAGDKANGMAAIYSGYLYFAYQNFDEAPETSIVLEGWGGQASAIFATAAISFPGTADVATILSGIAQKQNWKFENNGVQVQLSNVYLSGTALAQAQEMGRAAGIEVYLDTSTSPNTLAIWPKYGTRGGLVPLISPQSGLVGYPKFESTGMSFRTIFNRNIRLGGQIEMKSTSGTTGTAQVAPVGTTAGATSTQTGPNGIWTVISPLSYDLASQLPGGPWFTHVNCARVAGPGGSR